MKKLGLIGFPLGHSFSKQYYQSKFQKENINGVDYDLYPISTIEEFVNLYQSNPELYGVNVTIPYKQQVIPFLDELSEEAAKIGAVNCIQIKRTPGGKTHLTGHNTDVVGFRDSLVPLLKKSHTHCLILGTGGASKAVQFVIGLLGIDYTIVSRKTAENIISYSDLTPELIAKHTLIINCTPLGTSPKTEEFPAIPYQAITKEHLLYDLIYNPQQTVFLKKGEAMGAVTKNGYEMLIGQAEKNWEIWNM